MAPPDANSIGVAVPRTGSNSNTDSITEAAGDRQSRRTSSVMGPPPLPSTLNSSLPNSPRPPHAAMMDAAAPPQGPIRHPRPLTAAELHLELEKEQESIVNRLTRELSALRAQTASVASTTSSTSDLFTSSTSHPLPDYPYTIGTGASIFPTSARRHRSSSNLSARSARSARDTLQNTNSTSVSGVAAPRDADRSLQTSARQSLDIQRPETSRQNSYNLGPTSATSAPTAGYGMYRSPSNNATSPYGPPPGFVTGYGHSQSHRSSMSASHSRDPSAQGTSAGLGIGTTTGPGTRSPSFSSAHAAARYEEAAVQRQELEAVKKENEALKQKIRDLEKQLANTTT